MYIVELKDREGKTLVSFRHTAPKAALRRLGSLINAATARIVTRYTARTWLDDKHNGMTIRFHARTADTLQIRDDATGTYYSWRAFKVHHEL